MDRFSCQVHESGGSVVLAISGDVDMATHETLATLTARYLTAGAHVVLDCSGITFMDSMGLSSLLESDHRARLVGARLVLAALSAPVTRVLHLSGTRSCFEIMDASRPLLSRPVIDGIPRSTANGDRREMGEEVRYVGGRTDRDHHRA